MKNVALRSCQSYEYNQVNQQFEKLIQDIGGLHKYINKNSIRNIVMDDKNTPHNDIIDYINKVSDTISKNSKDLNSTSADMVRNLFGHVEDSAQTISKKIDEIKDLFNVEPSCDHGTRYESKKPLHLPFCY